jgi:hypothetical protein
MAHSYERINVEVQGSGGQYREENVIGQPAIPGFPVFGQWIYSCPVVKPVAVFVEVGSIIPIVKADGVDSQFR